MDPVGESDGDDIVPDHNDILKKEACAMRGGDTDGDEVVSDQRDKIKEAIHAANRRNNSLFEALTRTMFPMDKDLKTRLDRSLKDFSTYWEESTDE